MAEIIYKPLTVDNLFDCCAVIDAVGAEQILGAFNQSEIAAMTASGKDASGVGLVIAMRIGGIIIRNVPKARKEICTFIAGCTQWDNGAAVTAEEVKNMRLDVFVRTVKGLFQQEGMSDFFREVAAFAGMAQTDSGNVSSAGMATLTVI